MTGKSKKLHHQYSLLADRDKTGSSTRQINIVRGPISDIKVLSVEGFVKFYISAPWDSFYLVLVSFALCMKTHFLFHYFFKSLVITYIASDDPIDERLKNGSSLRSLIIFFFSYSTNEFSPHFKINDVFKK